MFSMPWRFHQPSNWSTGEYNPNQILKMAFDQVKIELLYLTTINFKTSGFIDKQTTGVTCGKNFLPLPDSMKSKETRNKPF